MATRFLRAIALPCSLIAMSHALRPSSHLDSEFDLVSNSSTAGKCCLYIESKKFEWRSGGCMASAILTDLSAQSCETLNAQQPCASLPILSAQDCYAMIKSRAAPEQAEAEPDSCCCKALPASECKYKVVKEDGKERCCKARKGGCPFLSWYSEREHSVCGLPSKPAEPKSVGCYSCKKGQGSTRKPSGLCNSGFTSGGTNQIFPRSSTEECHGLYPIDCEANPKCTMSSYGACVGKSDEQKDQQQCRSYNTRSLPGRYAMQGCFPVSVRCE